ncbi:11624_t:CDS:2 [Funneliformis mosseae]|uniref:11624_t:CDS:1 n=1 Tax=Funneliformis mosseae TaxID=27381 RepID=A0A9N9A5B6_FUNMO|nr:11624_t:CDS:2 [Funneliformis mosseae]
MHRYWNIFTLSVAAVILIDGFTKIVPPGSILSPMDTSFFPSYWMTLPLAFGLTNTEFANHALLNPSIVYLMFGPDTLQRSIAIKSDFIRMWMNLPLVEPLFMPSSIKEFNTFQIDSPICINIDHLNFEGPFESFGPISSAKVLNFECELVAFFLIVSLYRDSKMVFGKHKNSSQLNCSNKSSMLHI